MWRGVRVRWAVVAAAVTASRFSPAHDLVTAPTRHEPSTLAATPNPAPTLAEHEAISADRDTRPSALLLDLRTGYGLPFGEARTFAKGRRAADTALGYLTESGRYAGVTAGVSELDSNVTGFSETTVHVGVDLGYRPTMPGKIQPWVAIGFAWQILWLIKGDFSMTALGPEIPIVKLGADYRLNDNLAIGPFGAFAYRRYDAFSVRGQTPLELTRVTGRDAWLVLGISARFAVSRF